MYAALSSLAVTTALLAAPEISVDLKGAHSVACAPAQAGDSEACFAGTSSVPISLEVRSADGKPTIHKITFGIFQTGKSAAIASGQLIDGRGKSIYLKPLPLPHTKSAGCGKEQAVTQTPGSYVVQTEIGTGENVLSRQMVLEILADKERGSSTWPIGDTGVEIAPEGEWREMRGHRAMPGALDIEACAKPGVRIVAFIVQPLAGVSLTQYVTHSIEAYSHAAMWRVGNRKPIEFASFGGEHLSLEQTIGGVSVPVEKYFIPVESRIVILSIYGLPDREARGLATSIHVANSRSNP